MLITPIFVDFCFLFQNFIVFLWFSYFGECSAVNWVLIQSLTDIEAAEHVATLFGIYFIAVEAQRTIVTCPCGIAFLVVFLATCAFEWTVKGFVARTTADTIACWKSCCVGPVYDWLNICYDSVWFFWVASSDFHSLIVCASWYVGFVRAWFWWWFTHCCDRKRIQKGEEFSATRWRSSKMFQKFQPFIWFARVWNVF